MKEIEYAQQFFLGKDLVELIAESIGSDRLRKVHLLSYELRATDGSDDTFFVLICLKAELQTNLFFPIKV